MRVKYSSLLLFAVLFIIVFMGIISATISLGNSSYSIEKKYGPSQNIIGWINFSVSNEDATSTFKDSLNNEISLINLLNQNPNINYSCLPSNCEKDFFANNAETVKRINQVGSEYSCNNGAKIGDINGDGLINNVDSNVISNIVNGIIAHPSNICCADADKNGIIQAADTSLILQIIAGTKQSPGTCTVKATGGEYYYGMYFTGQLVKINSINFETSASGVPAMCNSQLEIDFFNDGIIDFANTEVSSDVCATKTYECYNSSIASEEFTIDSTPYCQKVNLTKAPGFRLGAWVKKISGDRNIIISILDKYGVDQENGYCLLPSASTSGGEVYCDVAYPVQEPEEYYICLYSTEGDGVYKTKGYSKANGCGFYGNPPQSGSAAYDIFFQSRKYASFTSLNALSLDDQEYLAGLTEDYIMKKYGSFNCSNGCVVPIKFTTNTGSTAFDLSIKNINIDYEKSSGIVSTNNLYDLIESPAKINSKFGKVYLDNSGLKVRGSTGNFAYVLKFKTTPILSETLSVQNAPIIKSITPIKTAYAFPTTFQLDVDKPLNVSKYEWDFGGNITTTTTVNKATHIYNDSGSYNLKVVIKDFNNISSSRNFVINVTSPKDLINSTLIKMQIDLENIKKQINTYDLFYIESLNNIIDTNNLSSRIKELDTRFKAENETQYESIVEGILDLKVPNSILTSEIAPNFIYYPQKENIDLTVLNDIGEKYSNAEKYIDAVYSWNIENIDNKVTFEEISARYDENSEPLLRTFKFTITEKNQLNYNSYFVINDMENLNFKENYGQQNIGGYKYITLTGDSNTIVFSTTEDVNFENVPAFIVPPLNKLVLTDSGAGPGDEEIPPFNWTYFIIALVILLIIGVVAYILMQRWYRHRYEGHLFKNKNDLFNILNFIDLQRNKGIDEKEIHVKLKKTGWSSEQIKYAVRKHSGKRTGMFEIFR